MAERTRASGTKALPIMRGTLESKRDGVSSFALVNAGTALLQVMHAALKSFGASLSQLGFTEGFPAFAPLVTEGATRGNPSNKKSNRIK
jgi:hypothetical protein